MIELEPIHFDKQHFNNDKTWMNASSMSRRAQELLAEMINWVLAQNFPIVVTETATDALADQKLGRVSKSHSEGRAFDIRTRVWPKSFIEEFMAEFDSRHPELGAISRNSKKPTLMVYHDNGHGPHIHVQIRKDYAVIPLILASNKNPKHGAAS